MTWAKWVWRFVTCTFTLKSKVRSIVLLDNEYFATIYIFVTSKTCEDVYKLWTGERDLELYYGCYNWDLLPYNLIMIMSWRQRIYLCLESLWRWSLGSDQAKRPLKQLEIDYLCYCYFEIVLFEWSSKMSLILFMFISHDCVIQISLKTQILFMFGYKHAS